MFYGKKEEEPLDPNINHESKSNHSLIKKINRSIIRRMT